MPAGPRQALAGVCGGGRVAGLEFWWMNIGYRVMSSAVVAINAPLTERLICDRATMGSGEKTGCYTAPPIHTCAAVP